MRHILANSYQYLVIGTALLCLAAGKVHVDVTPDKNLRYSLIGDGGFLSPKAKKDLTSGLSTRVVVLARLIELPGLTVNQQLITLDSKYDLWEEKFYLSSSENSKMSYSTQSDVEKVLDAPGPFKWMPVSSLKNGAHYKIEIVESLNPMSQEKFESVQKWVTRQKLSIRGSGVSNDPVNSAVTPETSFSSLFYSLWKRASEGEVLTGELRREASSDIFTPESLKLAEKSGVR